MNFVRVVRGGTPHELEKNINDWLTDSNENLVDIKVTGAFDGKSDYYIAVLIFKS